MSNLKDYARLFIKNHAIFYHIYNLKNGFCKNGLNVSGGVNVLISGIRVRNNGINNNLYLGKNVRIYNCNFCIGGSNNTIYIEDGCSLRGTNFYMENDYNEIHIGSDSTTTGDVDLSVIEGTKLYIGKDCMISSNIYIATGDGHSVCDMEGRRKNFSKDIVIGNHVWIGTRVIVGKGARIGDNSIVAAGSVCMTTNNEEQNVVIGGNPAKIVKRWINWDRRRI